MTVLITRPKHDLITRYLCVWSEEILAIARAHYITVYDLEGEKANRKNLESYIKNRPPSFVFLNGHGNAEVVTGHDNEPLVDINSRLPEVIVYARSCDAGQVLGSALIKNGTQAFIGYRRKFICGYTPEKMWKPLEDPIARLFLVPSNLIVSTLLKGHSVQDAHARSKEEMYKNFKKMISSKATYEERYSARWLWSNLNNQVLLGEGGAKI
ncbi:MAG: hypothetical protein AAB449_03095 [Patescibacteria group bacterium]